jgi:L-alanine-DL-glutamate epimerase-like enolase superfamily enzyme
MRIVRTEVIPIALPFGERYRTASGELSAREMAVIKLHTDVGQWGLGEAVPLGLRGGPGLSQIAAELAACGAALADADASAALTRNPVEIRNWIWALLDHCRQQHVAAPVIAAIDIALHDLAGRLAGLPMWRLLASGGVRTVHCNATLDAGDPAHVGALAARQRSAGFETFKVKIGIGEDEARVAAVRRAVGPEARIRLDANGAFSPPEAIEMLGRLEPHVIELVEQPCAGVRELALVRAQTAIPIAADESISSVEDATELQLARGCDAATIKLAKVGGTLEALRIAAILPSYLSSALDGPIGIAAALHTAQGLPRGGYADGFAHGLATLGMFSALYGDPSGLLAPELTPPHAAGLGVEVDDAALRELRL